MAYYKCPDCATYLTLKWTMLKGHFSLRHKDTRSEWIARSRAEDKEEYYAQFEISEEDFNRIKGTATPGLIVDTGLSQNEKETPSLGTPKETPVTGAPKETPSLGTPEIITQYTGEPVERFRQVLFVNEVEPRKIQTLTNIMALSPWL